MTQRSDKVMDLHERRVAAARGVVPRDIIKIRDEDPFEVLPGSYWTPGRAAAFTFAMSLILWLIIAALMRDGLGVCEKREVAGWICAIDLPYLLGGLMAAMLIGVFLGLRRP